MMGIIGGVPSGRYIPYPGPRNRSGNKNRALPLYWAGTPSRFGTRSQGLHCCQERIASTGNSQRLGLPGRSQRDIRFASDAGEPTGTAGEPILRAILSLELMDTAVVVTATSAEKARHPRTDRSLRRHRHPSPGCRRDCGQSHHRDLSVGPGLSGAGSMPVLGKKSDGQVVTADYQQQVTLRVAIPALRLPTLSEVQNIAQLETG